MSQGQWKRLEAVERLRRGELSTEQAAQVLGLCERQVRRVRRAVEKRGAPGGSPPEPGGARRRTGWQRRCAVAS